MDTFVKLENITKIYHMGEVEIRAVDGIDFSIQKGEFVVIVGPSGAGKTTVLNILGGMDTASGGRITVDGQDITKYSERQLTGYRRDDIGFVFQFYNLIPVLTVKENIILPLKLAGKIIDEEDFKQIIKDLEIDDLLDKYPFECSGGQSQRVAVARTLVMHPKIIFADEPTGNLDGVRSKQLMQYLEKVNREKNITVIMVTHDPLDAAYSSQMYYIENGKIKDHLLKKDDSFDTYFNKIVKISMEL